MQLNPSLSFEVAIILMAMCVVAGIAFTWIRVLELLKGRRERKARMSRIVITFKDGTVKEWRHEARAGGSWTKTVKMTDGWVTVTNEYGSTESFPAETIKEVKTFE